MKSEYPGRGRTSVLQVSHNNFVEGGSDRYFVELSKLLVGNGHHVIPFCAHDARNGQSAYSTYFPKCAVNGKVPTPLELVRSVYSRPARRSIDCLLQNEPVDLAHLHIYYGKQTASILRPLRERGIPIVQTLHEYKLLCPVYTMVSHGKICEDCQGKHFWRALPKRCNRGSSARTLLSVVQNYVASWLGALESIDHFIAPSEFLMNKMVEHGVSEDRISTIHNFVDPDLFIPATEPGRYVLYFGRVERVKGIYTLLDAMESLPEVQCQIAGDGREGTAIENEIASRKLTNVKLSGFVSGQKLTDLVRGSICTVIPSEWYENCPLSVLESHAWGRPVIGADIGGIPELIEHGRDGLLVPPGDKESLADAIRYLAYDRTLAAEMGAAGRQKVEQRFNAAIHYEQVNAVYSRLLDRPVSN